MSESKKIQVKLNADVEALMEKLRANPVPKIDWATIAGQAQRAAAATTPRQTGALVRASNHGTFAMGGIVSGAGLRHLFGKIANEEERVARLPDGARAANDGQPVSACPYKPGTPEHSRWANDWRAETQGQRQADDRMAEDTAAAKAEVRRQMAHLPEHQADPVAELLGLPPEPLVSLAPKPHPCSILDEDPVVIDRVMIGGHVMKLATPVRISEEVLKDFTRKFDEQVRRLTQTMATTGVSAACAQAAFRSYAKAASAPRITWTPPPITRRLEHEFGSILPKPTTQIRIDGGS